MIADRLRFYGAGNVVVDPVMVASAGSSLIRQEAVQVLVRELLPLAALVTPNIPEAQVLSGLTIRDQEDMITAAKRIGDGYGCCVLLKGGHSIHDANDLLYAGGELRGLQGRRIDNPNTHGTGCTLSSAIAANLALGYDLAEAIRRAKEYLSGALAAMLDLGKGSGPLDHMYAL